MHPRADLTMLIADGDHAAIGANATDSGAIRRLALVNPTEVHSHEAFDVPYLEREGRRDRQQVSVRAERRLTNTAGNTC